MFKNNFGDMSRRKFVQVAGGSGLAIGSAALLGGCAPSNNESQSTSSEAQEIEVNWDEKENLSVALLGKDIKIACVLIAMQEGFFEEENLNVSYENMQNLNDGITAVSIGQVDVLPFGVIPSCTFVSQGSDVVVFGGTIKEGSEAIATPENKDAYKTVEDFRGKKIGCFRMETGHMVMKGYLRDGGLNVDQDDPNKDVEFVQLDSSASTVAAVQNGEIDLGFVNSGYGYVAEQGGAAVAFHVGDFHPDFPCCRQTTNRDFYNNNKSALVKFETALLRAYDVYRNDKDRTIAKLMEYSGQPEDYVAAVIYGLDDYEPAMIVQIDPDADHVVEFYQTMIDNGDIDESTPYRMEDHVDGSIYQAALREMIKRGEKIDLYEQLQSDFVKNNDIVLA